MIYIKKLKRPNKRSGYRLISGATTKVRGMVITNARRDDVYIDKFTPKKRKAKRK